MLPSRHTSSCPLPGLACLCGSPNLEAVGRAAWSQPGARLRSPWLGNQILEPDSGALREVRADLPGRQRGALPSPPPLTTPVPPTSSPTLCATNHPVARVRRLSITFNKSFSLTPTGNYTPRCRTLPLMSLYSIPFFLFYTFCWALGFVIFPGLLQELPNCPPYLQSFLSWDVPQPHRVPR